MTRHALVVWSKSCVALAGVAAILGTALYLRSKPTLDDRAHNVAVSMARVSCLSDGGPCPAAHYVQAQPLFLVVGLGVAALALVAAGVLFLKSERAPLVAS